MHRQRHLREASLLTAMTMMHWMMAAAAAAAAERGCTERLTDVPYCHGISTTAPDSLIEYVRKINSLPAESLASKGDTGPLCRTRECVDSAKGILCMALNGGIVPASIIDAQSQLGVPGVYLRQFARVPPMSGLAAMPNSSSSVGSTSATDAIDLVIPQTVNTRGNMFCVGKVASREHTPCFTQCVDALTSVCSRECADRSGLPTVVPKLSYELPCTRKGEGSNQVCHARRGKRFAVDIRMQPWASCMQTPFATPPAAAGGRGCVGRIPRKVTWIRLSFMCVQTREGVCAGGAVDWTTEPFKDPFLSLVMVLADFLDVNPMMMRPPESGRWSTESVPRTINNVSPSNRVTAHINIHLDGEDPEREEQRIRAIFAEKGNMELREHVRATPNLINAATLDTVTIGTVVTGGSPESRGKAQGHAVAAVAAWLLAFAFIHKT